MKPLISLLLVAALVGCGGDANRSLSPDPAPTGQGLAGTVEFWEGDFMPSVPPGGPGGSVAPVARPVFIHQAATNADVTPDGDGGFYTEILTPLVTTVESDDRGRFSAGLPAGTYSLFVAEDGRFYANSWSDSLVQPVTVEVGRVAEIQIKIDYLATY